MTAQESLKKQMAQPGGMPEDAVAQAQEYLDGVVNGASAQAGGSPYAAQIAGLYDRIMNRPGFRYDASSDPLFRQYRDQYVRAGRQAMQDTVGNSAALTGGYGNSWGQTAGYQAYGAYLRQLGALMGDLEQQAYERYRDEEDALGDRLKLALTMADREAKARRGGGGTRKEQPAAPAEELIYPDLPRNMETLRTDPQAPAVLLPKSSKGYTAKEWEQAQRKMAQADQQSFQQKARQAAQGGLTQAMDLLGRAQKRRQQGK